MLVAGFILASLLASIVNALPSLELVQLSKRQGDITSLSPAQISSFKPFTFFAGTAYCNPSKTINWSCGASCAANSDFIPMASGGDGANVQFWYVGFSPSQKTVIVAHQGTSRSHMQAISSDYSVKLESLDPVLFPGVSSSIQVHGGFKKKQAKTATHILSAVKRALAKHRVTQVTIVGHSLGGAIALLDGVYLPLHIRGLTIRVIGYGMPRVGNQAFANYVDANLSVTRINNREDSIPTFPSRFWAYHHSSGEVHILDSGYWVSCPGQENSDRRCTVGDVLNVSFDIHYDNLGPYDHTGVGC